MNIGRIDGVDLIGLKPFMVQCQAFQTPGLPYFALIGLEDSWGDDVASRIRFAVDETRLPWPEGRVTVNLSPAAVRKRNGVHELAIALSVIDLAGGLTRPAGLGPSDRIVAIGGLDEHGDVTPVRGVVAMLERCRERGVRHVVIPAGNMDAARMVGGLTLYPVDTLADAATRLDSLRVADYSVPDRRGASIRSDWGDDPSLDGVREAAVAAAAGRHHMLIGTDYSSLSDVDGIVRCMRSLLPRLDGRQAMELARIRDVKGIAGPLGIGLDDLPPLSDPFHFCTVAGVVGDGVVPGAASLADHGVLYLAQAEEFSMRSLMGLLKPMDTGEAECAAVAGGRVIWPADFQLAGVMLRCPCGLPPESCRCTERELARHRLPALFEERCAIRIDSKDIQSHPAPSLADARAMVADARARQQARFTDTAIESNNRIGNDWLEAHTSWNVLALMAERAGAEEEDGRLALNAGRLAWTMADLAGHAKPGEEDAMKALGMVMGDESGRCIPDHASSVCDPAATFDLEQPPTYGTVR
ncbi:ATPase-like magnesium chelatase subunit ChlI [Bifidobacterium saguini DSM 23967]|uniref:ATPase-like magnesium chelatase subunit ChlI n=2 Tax=Bifidobacterium saguini TaxID=762210 RepID=A0A087D5N7_9BIFI|nr:ATP-binding protein [Bifidobacterium saguini]KFI90837.1 ATPase-like magnesium chelatase subunit ChlI [Bifidobacterium saguini DSM 23967]QTB90748.1 ATP-binding protein [Bifidobacterium saguini]